MIDLTPAEMLMLHYAPTYADGNNSFQGFWNFRYNISDPQALLNSLLQKGYVTITGSRYVLSDSGAQAVKDTEYIRYIHSKHFDDLGLNIYTMADLMSHTDEAYKKVIIDYLLKKPNPVYYEIGLIYSEIGEYNSALICAVKDLCVFLGGVPHNYNPAFEKILVSSLLKQNFPYEKSMLRIPVGRLRPLKSTVAKLKLPADELSQRIENIIVSTDAMQLFFTSSEIRDIICGELAGDTERLTAIYSAAENRYRTKFKL